jgi:hypothetical protein
MAAEHEMQPSAPKKDAKLSQTFVAPVLLDLLLPLSPAPVQAPSHPQHSHQQQPQQQPPPLRSLQPQWHSIRLLLPALLLV